MKIWTTDLHCGGGTVRVVLGKELPPILGKTLLEKRRYFRENLDYIRKFLLHEPRGHEGLYGIIVLDDDDDISEGDDATNNDVKCDVSLILLHNAGLGSFCGHGSIALGRYLIDTGIIRQPTSPQTQVTLRCPCGVVRVFVDYENGKTGKARFLSVPSYIFAKGAQSFYELIK